MADGLLEGNVVVDDRGFVLCNESFINIDFEDIGQGRGLYIEVDEDRDLARQVCCETANQTCKEY